MSTVKSNTPQRRFAQLAALGEVVFHSRDLANLWDISDKNTLHTTLKRYTAQGLIFRVFRGLYAIKPIDKLNPFLLGTKATGEFAYVSTETVLAKEGVITQSIGPITLVGQKSKNFTLANNEYKVRQLNDQFLFNPVGIIEIDAARTASLERAVADMLYFNPKAFFDAENLIDWKKVNTLQKEMGYQVTKQKI